ncbi:helicase domain protein [Xylanimonas cellulosilytica DSM 15894]|uniref:Helicase domain protein n=1 Tax=Xylanimonas cellulosilytica (strain DSM 15894 / JCM 12276 / CECT 5975 / KCTC 9989 / LMG 20990 / NBRC 107835 / XIL07) TaxID=446471 RepID=D1BVM2_XYLCX|nr:helicase domain protein [Xylanimonas cellulosilytica DSM 15894]
MLLPMPRVVHRRVDVPANTQERGIPKHVSTPVDIEQTAPASVDGGLPLVPEPGQIVEVRGSRWAVANVAAQGLPRSPADEGRARIDHVVSLQSLDEDRMGEELTVIWELEVGHSVAPDQGLPVTIDGFDDPNRLAAFVDAVRWGAVTSADAGAFQAPFRSGANVEAYQLEPLRRALAAPRTNLLLADDVGLGKTIEAGLVIQELLLRHRARSVVIVCPPSLAVKWQDEMREKFGLEFVLVNSELMAEVRRSHGLNANPFRLFPRVIVSMAWLPGIRAQRLLREVYSSVGQPNSARRYAFDVLVVDEAHHVAPSSPTAVGKARGYAVDSKRTEAVRDLAKVCEHRLFLSATPHNGHTESFTALLEMIDNRRFSRGASVDAAALKEVTVRRLKRDIVEKGFKKRVLETIPFVPSDEEQAAFDKLNAILEASARANGRRGSGDIVSMLLKKRFLSSPFAFGTTLGSYLEAAAGSGAEWDDDEDEYYAEVMGSGQSDEEEGATEHPEFTALRQAKTTDRTSDPLVAATPQELAELRAWGLGFQDRPDSRLNALITWLDAICRPDSHWTNERVVIFTEYADTLTWIVGNLRQRGYGTDRLAVIEGSTDAEERELTRARFNADPAKESIRVLVATDAAGEGIDLQAFCHRLVNFDVPFNPSRLEQRIGRIDRYGQQHAPEVFQFLPDATSGTFAGDMDFMRRIAEKVANVADDLGSVNPVIDADIQNRFGRSETTAKRTKIADDGAKVINQQLAGGAELNRSLTQLANTYGEQKAAMHLTPANSRRVLDTALELTAQPALVEVGSDLTDAQVFEVPSLASSWQPALRGLDTRLRPGVPRPITFDDEALRDLVSDELVHVHLGHGLMQKASRILRSSLFSAESQMNRVTAVVVDGIEQSCVAAVSRLVLVGRGGLRLHEEVFLTGIRVRGQALAEAKVEALLEQTLDAENLALADPRILERLATEWNTDDGRLRSRLEAAVRRKADARQQAVAAELAKREAADTGRATEIFAAFRRNLTDSLQHLKALEKEAAETLFTLPEQQRQFRNDIRAMEDRLAVLSDEETREIAGIRERYTDVKPYVAAAAVVFALTPADAQQGDLA